MIHKAKTLEFNRAGIRRPAAVEMLEQRCLLSGTANDVGRPVQTEMIEYDGKTVEVVADRYIVSLQRPDPVLDAFGEVLDIGVNFNPGPEAEARIVEQLNALGEDIHFGKFLGVEHTFAVNAPEDMPLEVVEQVLSQLPDFRAVEPVTIGKYAVVPSGVDVASEGHLSHSRDKNIDAPEASDISSPISTSGGRGNNNPGAVYATQPVTLFGVGDDDVKGGKGNDVLSSVGRQGSLDSQAGNDLLVGLSDTIDGDTGTAQERDAAADIIDNLEAYA